MAVLVVCIEIPSRGRVAVVAGIFPVVPLHGIIPEIEFVSLGIVVGDGELRLIAGDSSRLFTTFKG